MAGLSLSLGRSGCCMLCSNQMYSTGFNIYQARTYHGEKSFYAKLLELANYTASVPQLSGDCMCSVCATMLSQVDQLEYQLSHLISQIRTLFHKMIQAQTGQPAAAAAGTAAGAPPRQPAPRAATQQGLPGGSARASSTEVAPPAASYPAQVKAEPAAADPSQQPSYFAKKSPKENGAGSAGGGGRRPSWTPSPAQPAVTSAAAAPADDTLFSLGAFLQTAAAAAAARPGPADFTDKLVRTIDSEDAYRFQCVLCNKLGDCAEAIRRHVRADHPGADRISFPQPATGAGKRKAAGSGGGGGPAGGAKVPRSITASSPAMAQKLAERAFVCAGCDRAFGCEAFLTRHVTSQHCGRMYSCQYCGKEFSRSDKKIRHERSHTGERPFSCRYCAKAFSRKDKCTYHEKSHTRLERPFECQRCGEVMSPDAYAAHRQACSDEMQATGSLWQGQPPLPPAAAARPEEEHLLQLHGGRQPDRRPE